MIEVNRSIMQVVFCMFCEIPRHLLGTQAGSWSPEDWSQH
jgi:hypothetical protein